MLKLTDIHASDCDCKICQFAYVHSRETREFEADRQAAAAERLAEALREAVQWLRRDCIGGVDARAMADKALAEWEASK